MSVVANASAAPEAAPPPTVLGEDQVIRGLELGLTRLVSTGAIADARGALILSTNLAMLGVLLASAPSVLALRGAWLLVTVTALCCLGSVAAVALAALPRAAPARPSIVFFAGISRLSRDAYLQRLCSISPGEYLGDLAEQCHSVARLTTFKFRCVRIAMILLVIAAVPWLACLFLAGRLTG
jgi:hypothetical protein